MLILTAEGYALAGDGDDVSCEKWGEGVEEVLRAFLDEEFPLHDGGVLAGEFGLLVVSDLRYEPSLAAVFEAVPNSGCQKATSSLG